MLLDQATYDKLLSEVPKYKQITPSVLSERLSAGKTVLRVIADAAPESGFEPAAPELEDVYFAALAARPAA